MFGLLSKLAEILSSYGLRLLDGRRGSRDTEVAERMLRVVLVLQELIVRGERMLTIAERLLAGTAEEDEAEMFRDLLARQVEGIDEVRSGLEESRELLATIDVELYLDLIPLLDEKSGLLMRWSRQATRSRYSTTTLFFLSECDLRQALEAGHAHAGPGGMDLDRADYLLAVSDGLRRARAREVRDIRLAGARNVRAEIDAARMELERARTRCLGLSNAIEQTFGKETMAALRRKVVRRKERRG